MKRAFLLLMMYGPVTVSASDVDTDQVEDPEAVVRAAEYTRLSEELEKLTQRGAWAGVERTYTALVATGMEPSFNDYVAGAYAARALGDIQQVRFRLDAAHAIHEDTEVINWMWDIDANYGRVWLAGDAGKVELSAAVMPFNPDQAKSVRFAIERVAETGSYDGYLPAGTYGFGAFEVKVVPRVQTTRIDVRTNPEKEPKKKKKKKGDNP